MHFVPKLALIGAMLVLATSTALVAHDALGLNGYIGKTSQEISTTLKEKGYDVPETTLNDPR